MLLLIPINPLFRLGYFLGYWDKISHEIFEADKKCEVIFTYLGKLPKTSRRRGGPSILRLKAAKSWPP